MPDTKELTAGPATDPSIMTLRKQSFKHLKDDPSHQTIKSKKFLASEAIQSMISEGVISPEQFKKLLTDVGSSLKGELTFDQFCDILDIIDEEFLVEQASPMQNGDEEEEEEEEPSPAMLENAKRAAFDQLKKNSQEDLIKAKDFIDSKEIRQIMKQGDLSMDVMSELLNQVGCSPSGQLTIVQFGQLIGKIDYFLGAVLRREQSGRNPTKAPTVAPTVLPTLVPTTDFGREEEMNSRDIEATGGDDDKTPMENNPKKDWTPEELRKSRLQFFEELKMKEVARGIVFTKKAVKTVRVLDLIESEDIEDIIAEGKVTEKEVHEVIDRIGSSLDGRLTSEQFVRFFDEIDFILEKRLNTSSSFDAENSISREKDNRLTKELFDKNEKELDAAQPADDEEQDSKLEDLQRESMVSQSEWEQEILRMVTKTSITYFLLQFI
jgi:hypothetical protein